MDPQLLLFRRQYLQLFEPEFLAWPPLQLLKDAGVQKWIYAHCFNAEKNDRLPPVRYQYRVLKLLLGKLEKAIEDPEEDVGALIATVLVILGLFFSSLSFFVLPAPPLILSFFCRRSMTT